MAIRLLACAVVVVQYLMVLCFFGEYVTTSFAMISKTIVETEWNEYPIQMQKMLLTILIDVQRPVHIKAFKNLRCNHEVLKEVHPICNIKIDFFEKLIFDFL